jgi:hypothetical protein
MPDSNSAIWPSHETFYLQSMLSDASSACESIDSVSAVVEAIDGLSEDETRATIDAATFLDQLQNLVLRAAALSRYFWPSRKKPAHIARGERLRWAFGVDERSPLHSRELRDSLEHFDERLDLYLQKEVVGTILPQYVGIRPTNESTPYHLFRAYFLDDGTFSLLGDEYTIPPLADEVHRIYNRLMELDESGGRLRAFASGETATPFTETSNERCN